jgi:hypothetical protein
MFRRVVCVCVQDNGHDRRVVLLLARCHAERVEDARRRLRRHQIRVLIPQGVKDGVFTRGAVLNLL